MNDLFQLNTMANLLEALIPEGTNKKVEIDGVEYSINKKDNKVSISAVEKFDDTAIKEYVSQFKENIKELDDCLFVKVTEEFKKSFNTKEFDKLLNLDKYSQEDANKVVAMMSEFSDIVCEYLQSKIKKLVELYEKF